MFIIFACIEMEVKNIVRSNVGTGAHLILSLY